MPEDMKESESGGYSRRSFLAKFAIGAAAIAGAGYLIKGSLFSGKTREEVAAEEFPGPDSIFHPRGDPRLKAQERRRDT